MQRSMLLAAPIVHGHEEVVLELAATEVASLALEVVLLLRGLSDRVALRAKSGLEVAVSVGAEAPSRAAVTRWKGGSQFALSQNDAEYLCSFLLRSYRDGFAQVNHVTIDGHVAESGSDYDLTIMFASFAPPMPGHEATDLIMKD